MSLNQLFNHPESNHKVPSNSCICSSIKDHFMFMEKSEARNFFKDKVTIAKKISQIQLIYMPKIEIKTTNLDGDPFLAERV